jgi:hypothetical protein
MSVGKEHLHQLHQALAGFEEAIKQREHPGMLGAKVSLQQDVDKARQKVVDAVLDIIAKERLRT